MKKNLHYHIGLDKIFFFFGLILIATTSTMAQNTIADTVSDATVDGISMIDVDLHINPRYPILYSDIPDTIFVYERLNDNTLVVFDKYAYDRVTKKWFSINGRGCPYIKMKWRRRRTATIVDIKPDK